jgi:hypothetical protein
MAAKFIAATSLLPSQILIHGDELNAKAEPPAPALCLASGQQGCSGLRIDPENRVVPERSPFPAEHFYRSFMACQFHGIRVTAGLPAT